MKNYPCNYEGQRIRKEVVDSSKETPVTKVNNYYYNGEEILYITDTNDKKITENILDTDITLRFYNNQPTLYTLNTDGRGSTSVVVDSLNRGITGYKYDEFGSTEIVGNTEFNNEICYTGQVYDKETGDYYYNARYYSPDEGRFVTVDTYRGEFEEPLSLHLYAYCANNPINLIDPSGHKYDRQKVRDYAASWYYRFNPLYRNFKLSHGGGDCANFASQCIHAGGKKMTKTWYHRRYKVKNQGKNVYRYEHSKNWINSTSLFNYFKSRSDTKKTIKLVGKKTKNKTHKNLKKVCSKYKVQKGDLIYWSYGHAGIVSNITKNGILYTAHTTARFDYNLA